MAGIIKTAVRLGVIGGVVGVAAIAIAGPDRIMAVLTQARRGINTAIDKQVDDPIALRNQLRSLERQYPERVIEIQGELAEVNAQMAQLERELAVSSRVVQLTEADLDKLQGVIARAQGGEAGYRTVSFGGEEIDLQEAYAKANRVRQLHGAYATKVDDVQRDLGFLGRQQDRLVTLLEQIELERAQFNAKLWQLEQEVSAIARNERLIEMIEERQERLDAFESPYSVATLDQFNARLADTRAKQEARLEMLSQRSDVENYEQRAKYLLDQELGAGEQGQPDEPADDASAGRIAARSGG